MIPTVLSRPFLSASFFAAVTCFAGRAVVPWHVMITTYSYFEADTGSPDRAFLRSIPFDVMALDEAHNIKNAASSRHR
jgi:SNF2 family DNA or RNA helicase